MTLVHCSWDEARAATRRAGAVLGTERVPLTGAVGRTLAADVRAATDLPATDSSAMDGWAVAGPGPWRVVGRLLAGDLPPDRLVPGTAVEIATGGVVPADTLGILRWERGRVAGAVLHGEVAPGADVRPAGEEAERDEVVVTAGTRLRPVHLGLAAASGHDTLAVRRRPAVHVLVTGQELLERGPARAGRVRDSLGPQLPGWVEWLGGTVVAVDRVADDLDAHTDALAAAGAADVVLVTGGTAAGPVDHVTKALAVSGATMLVQSVAVRPGHPMLLACLPGGTPVVGLPGNPQSALAALLTIGAPAVEARLGRAPAREAEVRLAADVPVPEGWTRLVPCTRTGDRVTPVAHLGPGMLRGLAEADGVAVVDAARARMGGRARWLPVPG